MCQLAGIKQTDWTQAKTVLVKINDVNFSTRGHLYSIRHNGAQGPPLMELIFYRNDKQVIKLRYSEIALMAIRK